MYITWIIKIFTYLHVAYTREDKKLYFNFYLSVTLADVFLLAFSKKMGGLNLMNLCTKVADLPKSNIGLLSF